MFTELQQFLCKSIQTCNRTLSSVLNISDIGLETFQPAPNGVGLKINRFKRSFPSGVGLSS